MSKMHEEHPALFQDTIREYLSEADAVDRALTRDEMNEVNQRVVDEIPWQPLTTVACGPDGRHYELLYSDPHATIWLLDWTPHCGPTEIHSHGASRASINVVQGEIYEYYWSTDSDQWLRRYAKEGDQLWLGIPFIHKVGPNGKEVNATSIHTYSPGLHQMEYWHEDENGFPEFEKLWQEEGPNPDFC